MIRGLVATLLLPVALPALAQVCPVPADWDTEPYPTLATASGRDQRWVRSECMFQYDRATHADAIAAGFKVRDMLYGQTLGPAR